MNTVNSVLNINTPTCINGNTVNGAVYTKVKPILEPGDAFNLQDCASVEPVENISNDLEAFNNGFIGITDINRTDSLKVSSYNMGLAQNFVPFTQERLVANEALLADYESDVICFQEYYYDNNKEFITRELILKELGFEYFHESFTNESKNSSKFGLATFSRFPIVNKQELEFKNDHSNHCMWSDINIKSDTLRIFNAHMGSIRFNHSDYNIIGGKGSPLWPHQKIPEQDIYNRLKIGFSKRSQQIKELFPKIKKSPYNNIICVDLNDTPLSYAYNQFNNHFKDAFTISGFGFGGTYIGKIPFLRIDYIWHDQNLQSLNFKTHKSEFSDHRAISTEILIH